MVVVVIIGILVAIAIPIYSSVQRTAQERAFRSNHRILVGGITIWQAENDGALPVALDDISIYIDGNTGDLLGNPIGASYVWVSPVLTSTWTVPETDLVLTFNAIDGSGGGGGTGTE